MFGIIECVFLVLPHFLYIKKKRTQEVNQKKKRITVIKKALPTRYWIVHREIT